MMGNENGKVCVWIPFITIKWHLNHLVEADIVQIMGCVEKKYIEWLWLLAT